MYSCMAISTRLLLQEAERRGLDIEVISASKNTYALLWQGKEYIFKALAFDNSSSLTRICGDKHLTGRLLERWGVKIPRNRLFAVSEEREALRWAEEIKLVVVKPLDAAHGNGISVLPKLSNFSQAWDLAKAYVKSDPHILMEEFVEGEDYRFFFLKDTCIFVSHRIPAHVVGDGEHTIEELIAEENAQSYRGEAMYSGIYSSILIDAPLVYVLERQGMTLASVPAAGEKVVLRLVCNIGQGGTVENVLDRVHPDLLASVQDFVKKLDMRVVAVDVRSAPIENIRSFQEMTVLELNACPGIVLGPGEASTKNAARIWDALLASL